MYSVSAPDGVVRLQIRRSGGGSDTPPRTTRSVRRRGSGRPRPASPARAPPLDDLSSKFVAQDKQLERLYRADRALKVVVEILPHTPTDRTLSTTSSGARSGTGSSPIRRSRRGEARRASSWRPPQPLSLCARVQVRSF